MNPTPDRRPTPARRSASHPLRLERLEAREVPAVYTVSNTNDSGPGSLRQALLDANAHAGADTVRFSIASGVQTIRPATSLPAVTDPVALDATSQPGYAGAPLIVLDGSAAPGGASGLVLSNHTGSTVRGFVIENWSKNLPAGSVDAAGINLRNGGGHTIQGNYIGTDGTVAQPNGYVGILVNNSANNLIGGATAAERNVIAGNTHGGVYIVNPQATGNRVQGNYIGTDATGTKALTDGTPATASTVAVHGVSFDSLGGVAIAGFGGGAVPAGKNLIGGTDPGTGNLIANEQFAVQVVGSSGNRVLGNSLHDNGVAILLDSGYHPNDAQDADAGANNLQNAPVLSDIAYLSDATTGSVKGFVNGTLSAAPNTTYRIEFFRNDHSDSDFWGQGQAQNFVSAQTVTTDGSGNANFAVSFDSPPWRQFITATATNVATGDTSAVSRPLFFPGEPGVGGAPPGMRTYAVAAQSGAPRVWVYNPDGSLNRTFLAYDPAFTGGVRVAMGDVNGDGTLDIITAPGAGGGPHVKVFDGATGNLVREFMAYDPAFRGGAYVAAGDVTGDGKADIVTGAGFGGGPHVKVFDGGSGGLVSSLFPYDPNFRGGVQVAAGDVDGDGKAEVITAAGPGGGPHVRVINIALGKSIRDFMAYDPAFTGGVYVTAGDFNGDGKADIATAPMAGGGPHVRVFDSASLTVIREAMVFDPSYRGGTPLAMRDVDDDGTAEVLAAVQDSAGAHVRTLKAQGQPADLLASLDASAGPSVALG